MNKIVLSFAKSRAKFLLFLLVIEIIILSILNPDFAKIKNLIEILQFGATTIFLALGESLVILSIPGGIDISIGSIVSLSCVIFGKSYAATKSIVISGLIALICGTLMGCLNGIMVGYFNMSSLIATLGTQYIFSSIALYITNGVAISGFPDSFQWLSLKTTLGIPNQILFAVIPITLLIMFLVYRTKFGRDIYLTGDNAEAAKFAAINTKKTIFLTFALAGLLSAIGAIVNCSWLMTARADAGSGMEMSAITIAMLGGISAVEGGRGRLSGVIVGSVIITMLNSGLQMGRINTVWRLAISGIILILSIIFNDAVNKMLTKSSKVG